MSKHHQRPNYACKRSKIMPQTSSRKSKPFDPSSLPSMNLQNIKTHPLTSSIPLLERISPCSTNMTNPDGFLLNEELDTHQDLHPNMKMKTLLQRIGPKNPELDPLSHRGHQESEPLTNRFSPGSRLNQMKIFSSPPVKNSLGKWSKTMPLTSSSRNLGFSAPNESPNFLTWSGIMSLPENPSTLMSFSPECIPPQPTTEQLKILVSSNSTLAPTNQPSQSKPMATGSSHGKLPTGLPNSSSPIVRRNSRNIPNISPPTSHHCTQPRTGKFSNSIRPSGNEWDRSTTSPSMNSANSDISRLVTSTGTALATAVPNPSRKRPRSPELEPIGGKLTHAAYGMTENVRKRHRLVSTGTSARTAEDHIARPTALEEKSEALERRGHRPQFARQLIWDADLEEIGPTTMYSLTAEPLPRPPLSAFTETLLKTISENPDLFKITCLIHVDVFESLLIDHPNPLFCQSVFTGLREGFWPWPDKPENYPETHDNSCRPPKTDEDRIFLAHQVLSEQKAGRLFPTVRT